MRGGMQIQMTRYRRADIGEGVASPDRTARDLAAERDDGNAFARVIAAFPGRIAAVIAGYDREVPRPQQRKQLGQSRIESLECRRVAGRIAAVTVQSVEVDEIREYEATLSDVCERIEHAIDDAIIVGRLELASGRGVTEEIRDLPDGYDVASRC